MLSIIIPVYNIEEYIGRCLNSIVSQKFTNYEIIIVDDGSTDRSLTICEQFAEKYNNIIIFTQVNSGVSVARNKGIAEAKGKWICFVDGDDFIEQDSLANIFEKDFNTNTDCIIARSFINTGEKISSEKYVFDQNFAENTYEGISLSIENGYFRGSIWGVFYKKELLDNNNILFPIGIKNGEDSIFFSQVLLYAKFITFSNNKFYYVFEREGSASRSWNFDRILLMVNNIFYLQNYINTHPKLKKEQINILHYDMYRTVSSIYNNLSVCFSLKSWVIINKELKKILPKKLDIGEIKISKKKVELLNKSLIIYSLSVLFKNVLK